MSDSTQNKTKKAKRKLSDFDFSSQDSHIALVGPVVGGPANERTTLVFKANKKFSEETILKMQQVQVTMELPDFLRKFFDMWYEDAEILARLLGYVAPKQEEYEEFNYEDYLEEKLEAFKVIKSLKDSKNLINSLAELDENQYLALLKDQEKIEKCLRQESAKSESSKQNGSTEVNSDVGADTEAKAIAKAENPAPKFVLYKQKSDGGWEPTEHNAKLVLSKAVENKVNLEEKMTDKVTDTQVADVQVEVVEKSAIEAIEKAAKEEKETLEKALAKQTEDLQKALALVAEFEKEKKEAITKSRFEAVKSAVKSEETAEVLFKALSLVEDQAEFETVVKALKDMSELSEKGELFVEKGVSVEGEGADSKKDSAVAKLLKAQAAKTK